MTTSTAAAGGQRRAESDAQWCDSGKNARVLAELGMSGAFQPGGQHERWVLGDELDQSRAHPARGAVDADREGRCLGHGSPAPFF